LHNELPRPLGAPFQATAAMLLAVEVTATVWLPSRDVISARQCSYPVSARQTVHLPGKSTVWRRSALFGGDVIGRQPGCGRDFAS